LPVATLTGEGSSGRLPVAEVLVQTESQTIATSQAPPARTGAEQVLDGRELLARVDGNRTLLAEIVRLFLEERASLLGVMELSLDAKDMLALAREAHKAKGAFGNLSAPRAQHAAATLEQLAEHGDVAAATEALVALRIEVDRLEQALQALTRGDRAA
jgi:HPt (histidine-containing phosphotransfer) domain-containing protein